MKRRNPLFVLFVGQFLGAVQPNLCSAPPPLDKLERDTIKYRLENTKRGYVRMHVIDEEPTPRRGERLYDITFDEQRVRQIRLCRLHGGTQWGKPEKIIVTPEKYMTDDEYTPVPTVVQLASTANYKSPREQLRVLNIQALGMDLGGADFLHIAQVESLLNRADRTSLVVSADRRSNLETWRIDYKKIATRQGKKPKVSIWIAPSQGFSVIAVKVQSDIAGKKYDCIVDSQLKQYPEGGVWYPSKVTKEMKKDGRLVARQTITVEEARFGGSIDETAFTLSGLELEPGRKIVDSTSGQAWGKVWDGKKTVDPSVVKTAPATPIRNRRPRWLQLMLAAGLGLLAAIYFWRAFRRRRSTSHPGA